MRIMAVMLELTSDNKYFECWLTPMHKCIIPCIEFCRPHGVSMIPILAATSVTEQPNNKADGI